jgi:type I restriction enzyme R subunit
MDYVVQTTRFTRGQLPHWEIKGGRYFVTVRCADSLPTNVVARLHEITATLALIESGSDQFIQLQRRYFQTMEKYLDSGRGEALLAKPEAAEILALAFAELANRGVSVPHYSIMPNHWHAMFVPVPDSSIDLHSAIARLKGQTAYSINRAVGRRGPLWQREWFDRWMRTDDEWQRCVDYVRNNPVKAGIVRDWREHPWTR